MTLIVAMMSMYLAFQCDDGQLVFDVVEIGEKETLLNKNRNKSGGNGCDKYNNTFLNREHSKETADDMVWQVGNKYYTYRVNTYVLN